ncbi:unnamed protein product, partial [Mycena citricolor]
DRKSCRNQRLFSSSYLPLIRRLNCLFIGATTMFKSAATKIAHNSTLTSLSLGGNKDLRPLQDLITAEKAVLISLQKLSVDLSKAGDSLRAWGQGEGDDLGDILTASSTILSLWSTALTAYASREHAIRDQLKQIRTREEALDELKRRRKATHARADSAEKKLNKMGPEHKNLGAQTELLTGLQAQIRSMDVDIMNEETSLSDFKRSASRAFLGLKFGGLMECCEKGCIIAESGRSVVMEIPEDTTPPGMPRAPYVGYQRASDYVAEAERCVNEVIFTPLPSGGVPSVPRISTGVDDRASMAGSFLPPIAGGSVMGSLSAIGMQNTGMSAFSGVSGDGLPPTNPSPAFLPPPDVGSGGFMDNASQGGYQPPLSPPGSGFAPSSPGGYAPPSGPPPPSAFNPYVPAEAEPPREEVGVIGGSVIGGSSSGGTAGPGLVGGGHFATFPVRSRGLSLRDDNAGVVAPSSYSYSVDGPPSLGSSSRKDSSGDFMNAVMGAGEFGTSVESPVQEGSSSQPFVGVSNSQVNAMARVTSKQEEREQELQRRTSEEPAPAYVDYAEQANEESAAVPIAPTMSPVQSVHAQPPSPMPTSPTHKHSTSDPAGPPPGAAAPVVDTVWTGENLATFDPQAMNEGDRTSSYSDIGLAYMSMDDAPVEGESEQQREARLSRHVRFGPEGVFGETEPPMRSRQNSSPVPPGSALKNKRIPPPAFVDRDEEERALNAAAAREITLEIDALRSSHAQDHPSSLQPASPVAPPPQTHFVPPPKLSYSVSPPPREVSPSVPAKAPSIEIEPVQHTTPSWAMSPVLPAASDALPGSPSSLRGAAPWATRSTSSLNSGGVPAGARTISAAAFRRPVHKSSDSGDVSSLALRKRLPASPYPEQRVASQNLDSFDYISAYGRDSQAFFDDEAAASEHNGIR